MVPRIYLLLYVLSVFTTLVGCGSTEEPVVETPLPVASAPAKVDSPAPPAEKKPASEPEIAQPNAASAPIAQFSPPFPDRLELFEPPQRAEGTVQRDDAGETVELKGFINVDQPKVLLAIDGVIAPIPEGGEKYGVQVITIEPPSVVFQRGRNRRKLTLE
jgi:hypothetical protein